MLHFQYEPSNEEEPKVAILIDLYQPYYFSWQSHQHHHHPQQYHQHHHHNFQHHHHHEAAKLLFVAILEKQEAG